MKLNCVDVFLKKLFYKFGKSIGDNPGYFVIVPVLLTALCASGFQRVKFEADPEYLFSPTNGDAKHERAMLENHFPTNYSQFDPSRTSEAGRFGRLIITAADGGSLFRTSVWREINFLDDVVRNVTIDWEGKNMSYTDLCATAVNGYCWNNEILEIGNYVGEIESGNLNLTYPIWISFETLKAYALPMYMGGFNLSEIQTVDGVKALSLLYFLDTSEEWMVKRGSAWEASFLATVKEQKLPNIVVTRFTSLTLEVELEENTNSVIPYFSLNIGIMVIFCIMTCMMTDWVKSKPLLGLLGVISAILGSISAFGLVIYLGMDFIGINLAAPFLMLGIGIDDTFVMLAAWRRTSVHDSVPERMGQCYRDAAVSITITSITDMLSFWIGVITPFPCVQIFCVYTGACVVFTYFWHLSFFGGCMAMAGYAEKRNRHALTCCVVLPKSQAVTRSWPYRVFCSGGINAEDPWNPQDNKENGAMVFFRDVLGTWLNKPTSKALVLTIFLVYLGGACYGVSQLKEGLEKRRLSRFDSYSVEYYDMEDEYFRDFPFRINVVVSGELDYSSKEVQADMEELMTALENTTFIDGTYSESWLRDFTDYLARWPDSPELAGVTDEQTFNRALKETYLIGTPLALDVDFERTPCKGQDCIEEEHIVGSRFVLQGTNIRTANDEAGLVLQLRAVCDASKYNVTVFHPYFIYFDQFLIVLPTTVQCVVIAAVVMMIVSLIFIPNPICSLWVAFSIMSIELGVIGFMTFWGVNLDSISMINLIMCIGFSVDFSAHISYHYLDVDGPPSEKVKNSLYGLGLPILQGAVSTILGVLGLMLAPSYIFVTFFKMVFLVILLGAMHGLFLLPVLLSLFGPGSCSEQEKHKPKSASTSYLSDGGSLPAGRKGEVGLRIPRPATTSSSLSTPTDLQTSGSSPGSNQASSPGSNQAEKKQKRTRRSRQHQLHEMYHNNGYLSEEDNDELAARGWRSHPRGAPPPGPLVYYNKYPPAAYYPQYAFPADRQARAHSRDSRDCRSKSKECKKKRPKH